MTLSTQRMVQLGLLLAVGWFFAPCKALASAPESAHGTMHVTVLPAGQASVVTPPGKTVNVTVRFEVAGPLPDSYSLALYLLDAHGAVVAQLHNNLNNNQTILPTTSWSGPVALTLALPVPAVPDGVYSIRVGLEGWAGLMRLTAGPGVKADDHLRYAVGTIRVQANAAVASALPPATLDLTGYKLTFDDEFKTLSISDSPTFDGARWYTRNEECCMQTSDGTETAMVRRFGPTNPYSQLPGGGLDIRLQRQGRSWTSGVLTSVDNTGRGFSQQYGYFEMKARFPKGLDTWPAFWLISTEAKRNARSQGEIDIVEYIANPAFADYIATTLHDWTDKTTPAMSHYRVTTPTDGFHTYGMMWTAETMTFYFDGAAMMQAPTPAIMHQPYYLLVDLGIGAGWPTEGTPAMNDMEIQYIRAYSR